MRLRYIRVSQPTHYVCAALSGPPDPSGSRAPRCQHRVDHGHVGVLAQEPWKNCFSSLAPCVGVGTAAGGGEGGAGCCHCVRCVGQQHACTACEPMPFSGRYCIYIYAHLGLSACKVPEHWSDSGVHLGRQRAKRHQTSGSLDLSLQPQLHLLSCQDPLSTQIMRTQPGPWACEEWQ